MCVNNNYNNWDGLSNVAKMKWLHNNVRPKMLKKAEELGIAKSTLQNMTYSCKGRSKKVFGTFYNNFRINMQPFALKHRTQNESIETYVHEHAHWFDFILRGFTNHDERWRKIFIFLGGDGNRYGKSERDLNKFAKYELACEKCGYVSPFHRRLKKLYMCSCGGLLLPNNLDKNPYIGTGFLAKYSVSNVNKYLKSIENLKHINTATCIDQKLK